MWYNTKKSITIINWLRIVDYVLDDIEGSNALFLPKKKLAAT